MSINKTDPLVYVVDDEFAVRDSLTLLIESNGQAVRSFASAEAFLNDYSPDQAGCLLLDIRMPTMSGLELQDELNKRDICIPIIFISGHARIPDSAHAFRAGAVDFLEKPFDNATLMERIAEALKKDKENREQRTESLDLQNHLSSLTVREKKVLSLIIIGDSNKEIGKKIGISNRTVEAHRARIMEKMQAENLVDLMRMTTRFGILNDELNGIQDLSSPQ
jgi:two-component system response regulator FixJ